MEAGLFRTKRRLQASRLGSTKATSKPKRLDGHEDQQWSMLFNAIPRVLPHRSLFPQVLHGCLQFVSWDLRLSPLTNVTLNLVDAYACCTARLSLPRPPPSVGGGLPPPYGGGEDRPLRSRGRAVPYEVGDDKGRTGSEEARG